MTRRNEWAVQDLNLRPPACKTDALPLLFTADMGIAFRNSHGAVAEKLFDPDKVHSLTCIKRASSFSVRSRSFKWSFSKKNSSLIRIFRWN
jgi:hypothetical protein